MCEGNFIRLSIADNVIVLPGGGKAGGIFGNVTVRSEVPPCHKAAAEDIAPGEPVIKYGRTIGYAAREIKRGDWVHGHNMYSKHEMGNAEPKPWRGPYPHDRGKPSAYFMGYRRRGRIRPGVRNDLFVIPTAGCVKGELRYILSRYHKPYWIDSVRMIDCLPTCAETRDTGTAENMALGLAGNPNAAGVLFVGLGCEKMQASDLYNRALAEDCHAMCAILGKSPEDTVPRYLDDLAAAAPRVREHFPASELRVGLSGARGGYAGFTSNPLLSRLSDTLASQGAATLAAGSPELFTADDAISERITSRDMHDAFVSIAAANDVQDAPSMDDWENGVTTPEERALSLLPVLGESSVVGFLDYGERALSKAGLQITPGSGDEAVNCTTFAAGGAQIILFATAQGTPFGSVSPTVKISSGSDLAEHRPGWIDFDAGPILSGESIEQAAARLWEYILRVAGGEQTAHERKGFGEAVLE